VDGALSRGGVTVLDDAGDRPRRLAQHPPIAGRVINHRRQHGHRVPSAVVLGDQPRQRGGIEQRHIPIADQHRPRQPGGQHVQPGTDRITGTSLTDLHRSKHLTS
jgi:hypothetical protein